MLLSEHDRATCRRCGSPLWYGLKDEMRGWKVFYVCTPGEGCGSEWRVGRVGLADIDSIDEAYQQAEDMWTRLPE